MLVLRILLVCSALSFAVAASVQLPPPSATSAVGAISGVVSDGSSGRPIAEAVVSILGDTGRSIDRQYTDEQGRFVFIGLAPSDGYRLTATASGFLPGRFGQPQPQMNRDRRIALTAGAWFPRAHLSLWRPGGIAGTMTDERGEPVIGAYVRVLAFIRVAGHDRVAAGPVTTTDDRGRYRIGQLDPGRYVVMVPSTSATVPDSYRGSPRDAVEHSTAVDAATRLVVGRFPIPPPSRDGRPWTYPITFNGGAHILAAAPPIELAAGSEIDGVDLRLAPVRAYRVSGVVQNRDDADASVPLRLAAPGLEDLGADSAVATAVVGPDGRFAFANVPAGAYVLDAVTSLDEYSVESSRLFYGIRLPRTVPDSGGADGAPVAASSPRSTYWEDDVGAKTRVGRMDLTVDGTDRLDVVLTLQRTASVVLRVQFEVDPRVPSPRSAARVFLDSATADPRIGSVASRSDADLTDDVQLNGVPGDYVVSAGQWLVKAATWNGIDYARAPLTIAAGQTVATLNLVLTNAAGTITGVVRGVAPEVGDASVIAFPAEPAQWTRYGQRPARIAAVAAGTSAEYRLTVPGGDYYVIAVPASRHDDWKTPGFFERAAPLAARVSVPWGERVTRDLAVAEIK
jgi:hypothetical protein